MLRLLVIGAVLIVGIIASVWNRFAALITYVWYALFRPQDWIFTDISSLRLSFVFGALLILPTLLTGTLPNLTHPLSIGAVSLLATSVVAQMTTATPGDGWAWVDMLARLIVIGCVGVSLMNSRQRIVLFVATIAASIGFYSAKGGVGFLMGRSNVFLDGIGNGAYADNNGYAMAVAMVVPFMVASAQNLRFGWKFERWARMAFYAAVPLSALTIIGTKSRAGFLALIVLVLASIALNRRRFRALAVVGTVVGIGWMTVPLPPGYFDRIQTITTYEEVNETSAISRLHFWRVALRMVEANPLGVGPRNYDTAYDRYDFLDGLYGHRRSVHSSHLQVLAELGYGGFAVWICLFFYALWATLRVRRQASTTPGLSDDERHFLFTMSNALFVSMLAFLVGGAFIALALNDITWYTFATIAAVDRLAARHAREARAQVNQSPVVDMFGQRAARV